MIPSVAQVNEQLVSSSSAEAADRAIKKSIFSFSRRGLAGLWLGRSHGISRQPREKSADTEKQASDN